MPPRQTWMIPRPQRRLTLVPQNVAAFASVAEGKSWSGAQQLHRDFEDAMDRALLKMSGDYTDRIQGGGGGGRTHAAMLSALGLWCSVPDAGNKNSIVRLTLAGQALVDQEDAQPILAKQVLAHQYPSVYSTTRGVDVDRRFQVRPFVLLLRLLRHPELDGRLNDLEVGCCVLPYGERHDSQTANAIATRILEFRRSGMASLEEGFVEKFKPERSKEARFIKSLSEIANTAMQWLRYTGLVVTGKEGEVIASPGRRDEIDDAIEAWSTRPLLDLTSTAEGKLAFQRRYGLTPGASKDTRRLGQTSSLSPLEQAAKLVSAAVLALSIESVVDAGDSMTADAVVRRTGLPRDVVHRILPEVVGTPRQSRDRFLDRYRLLAFGGRDDAIEFERATASAFTQILELDAKHIGQGGRVPDVEVRHDDWIGIVDTKAYASYDLPSDHQLRMQHSYVPLYPGRNLAFFGYIAGGFSRGFDRALLKVIDATDVPGFGIGITAWITLLARWQDRQRAIDDLIALFQLDREITLADVQQLLDA